MDTNEALYLALRLAAAVLPFLPVSVAYGLATFVGRLAFYLVPQARHAIAQNLSVVLEAPIESHEVRRAARAAFVNDAKNWIDTLRLGRLRSDEIVSTVTVDGWSHLERALEENKGVILVTLHLGNIDLVGQVLAARGLKVTVPVEHMHPPKLFDLLVRQRVSQGINIVPVERAPREMLRALRAGEIVGVAGDRNVAGRVAWVDFFGRPAPLPRGALSLARRTGSPILVAIGVRTRSDRFHGFISAPLDLVDSANVEVTEHANTQRIAHAMEPFIRRFPSQWLVFAPVWPSPAAGDTERLVESRAEAVV